MFNKDTTNMKNSATPLKAGFAFAFTLVLMFLTSSSYGATLYSICTDGDWTDNTCWSTTSGGGSCGCTPGSGDDVIIETNMIMDQDIQVGGGSGDCANLTISAGFALAGKTFDMDVRGGATLTVNGDLDVDDLTLYNGCTMVIGSAGYLKVWGDFDNRNNSDDVTINGTLEVLGDFDNGNGGEITGSGTILYDPLSFTNDGTISGIDDGAGTISLGAALPIELVSFEVAEADNTSVEVAWTTATEIDNDYFTIERSQNGLSFENIAEVNGAGDSNSTIDYLHYDESPLTGTSYYRLKQTDHNGKFEYFDIKAVTLDAITNKDDCVLTVYPNPCPGNCTVQLSNCPNKGNSTIAVEMIDAAGHRVFAKVPNRNYDGSFKFSLDKGNNLKPGVYFVRAGGEDESYNSKVILN
jgi:hypothetical protein